MPTDLDLDRRLARVGAHLDALATRDGADALDPSAAGAGVDDLALRRATTTRPSRRRLALAAAVLVVLAAVGAFVATRPDGDDRSGLSTEPPTGSEATTAPPAGPSGADLLALRPIQAQAVVTGDCAEGWVPSTFGVCFRLGPAAFDADDVAAARAELSMADEWMVVVTVADDARASANAGFDACFEATPDCPDLVGGGRGAMAVVRQGVVVSAPNVQAPGLADDDLQLFGSGPSGPEADGYDEAEAKAWAAELS